MGMLRERYPVCRIERSRMYSKIISGGVIGVEGILIQVEADINDGLPVFNMVGYLSSCVREAGERVRTALKNSDFHLPPKRITINLSPAAIRKDGTAFDLPIAIGILTSMGVITQEKLNHTLVVGELSLDGHVNAVSGILPIIQCALKQGIKRCIVPKENGEEAALIEEMEVIPVDSLRSVVDYMSDMIAIEPCYVDVKALIHSSNVSEYGDFSEVMGHETLKRGIEIAAAGLHNVLMTGAAGAGKSMIARRIPTILPELTFEECLEVTKLYSIAGLLKPDKPIIGSRPFRAPHHTISAHALAGGGKTPKPGEISLAHNGVLFLDELPEFSRNALEVMRQPLEDREVTISRLNGIYRFPADFMLVAARNPCPCGNYPDINKCTCTINQIKRYNARISKPLLDRIDINVDVRKVAYDELFLNGKGMDSKEMKAHVLTAQNMQKRRYENETIRFNSQLDTRLCNKYIKLSKNEKDFMRYVFESQELSARGSYRILRIARTIADIEESDRVCESHLKEAVFFRNADREVL